MSLLKNVSAQKKCFSDKDCRGFMVKHTDVFENFFFENLLPSRVPSALVECSFDNPAWIYQLKILNTFAKTPILSNFFWKLPKRFPVKRSSAHTESILDNLVKSCPLNRKKFLPKSKRNINLLDLPRKTFWFKWSSEHLEFSNEKSAKIFPPKNRKLAALSKNLKLNLKFLPKLLLSLFSLETYGADSKSLPNNFREMSTEIRH